MSSSLRFLSILIFILVDWFTLIGESEVFAEGFFIDPQSVEGMGLAQAGAAIGYKDGSAGFYNPAALVTYDKPIASLQLHAFNPSAKLNDRGSTVSGEPNRGPNEANGGRDAAIPLLYSALPVSENLVTSLYINSPYGLGTEYPKDWLGRYQAVESSMKMVNIGSAAGIELGRGFSLGGGISAIYAEATLSSAIDFGTIGVAALGPQRAAALGLSPQSADGLVKVTANDWAMGWNGGALYQYGENNRNRIGLSYRSSADLSFHNGRATYDVPQSAQILTSSGLFTETSARSQLTLPQSATFGTGTHLSESVILYQQTSWTNWSQTKDLTVTFGNPAQPPSSVPQDWNDSWFHAIGVSYQATEKVVIRCGSAYENGIIPNSARRYPRLPTSDSIWGSIGMGIHFPESGANLDLSFTRVEYRGGLENSIGPSGDVVRGDWNNATNAVGTSVTFIW